MNRRILSGVRPTGSLHIGNYFGAIRQFLEFQEQGDECFYFVADIHALTEVDAKTSIGDHVHEVTKTYLACGIDPDRATIYRQTDVPEISEITVLLGNTTSLAQLRRCTTYKGKRDKRIVEALKLDGMSQADAERCVADGEESEHLPADDIQQFENQFSYGLLGYPVLMAADILAVCSDLVPVGADQKQHVEMARQFARSFNAMFSADVFTVPDVTEGSTLTVPGITGERKMGKSDQNTIALLEDPASARKKIMRMPTQSEPTGARTQATDNLYAMAELLLPSEVTDKYLQRWGDPGDKFFGAMKGDIATCLEAVLGPIQQAYATISDDDVQDVLATGAKKVRPIAADVLTNMRSAMGLTQTT